MGVFALIMIGLAERDPDNKTLSIDATYLKAHRTASSLRLKRGRGRLIGHTKGGMNTKLYAVTDTIARPVRFFIIAGQVSDYTGAAALMSDAQRLRDTLTDNGTKPCIPGRKSRTRTVKYDKRRYKRRNRIERMFNRIKDWRRVATRYNRSPTVFLPAIALAATVIFGLGILSSGRADNPPVQTN
ncbi:Transposase [Sulfitobacter marinus]|uniref:Transposase n=1 Tax=Sulfitobacter marinus TaxID=394264 RepID=A0A1I6Q141_9RHOB|nr:Transposase [Sulfitobacter marinus]